MSGTDNFEAVVKQRQPEAVAEFHEDTTLIRRIQHALHAAPSLVPLIVLLLSIAIFSVLIGTRFFAASQQTLILQQVQVVGILAVAQTLVILTAGIDLSVGAMMVLTSIVMGQFTFRYGVPAPLAVTIGLAAGGLMGFINGLLVAYVRLPPFIVTLGTLQIYFATNYLFSANETIRSQDVAAEAPILQFFGVKVNELFVRWYEGLQGIVWEGGRRPPATDIAWLDFLWSVKLPVGVIFMLLLTIVVAYVLRQTAWGRHVYAVGDDPEAAQLAGVNTRRTLISVYTVAGVICGFAGWASIGRNGSVSPTIGTDANLEAITAAVIGGISLFGGRGSVMGALFGALIVGVFSLGLRMMGANAQWTYLLIGLLIIVAVAIDQWIRKVSA